jgi:hypothetical protein
LQKFFGYFTMDFSKVGQLDIGLKCAIGVVTAVSAAAVITLPTGKEQEKSALELFDKPMTKLTAQEKMVAEFHAGHRRWRNFFEHKVYPTTRKLPGSDTPFLNPYRGLEPIAGGAGDDDDE